MAERTNRVSHDMGGHATNIDIRRCSAQTSSQAAHEMPDISQSLFRQSQESQRAPTGSARRIREIVATALTNTQAPNMAETAPLASGNLHEIDEQRIRNVGDLRTAGAMSTTMMCSDAHSTEITDTSSAHHSARPSTRHPHASLADQGSPVPTLHVAQLYEVLALLGVSTMTRIMPRDRIVDRAALDRQRGKPATTPQVRELTLILPASGELMVIRRPGLVTVGDVLDGIASAFPEYLRECQGCSGTCWCRMSQVIEQLKVWK
ncbi:hypothetical protein D9615_006865 [Tricholomella constricta]|uniref:Uncharacterized protein n=1 Tax=Tricholomella constricta TaxID=117010 RepID=A0A8H5H940_9AGAR|nr:hypothetical protein D9615_006865 [Tricholomella constricta]